MKVVQLVAIILAVLLGEGPTGQPVVVPRAVGVVGLRIVVDGTRADVRVRVAQAASVTAIGKGTVWVTPALDSSRLRLVVLWVADEGEQATEPAQLLELNRGEVGRTIVAGLNVELEWTELIYNESATGSPSAPCSRCCVLCDDHLVCACSVETTCGRCCCPDYCSCPTSPVEDGCSTVPVRGQSPVRPPDRE